MKRSALIGCLVAMSGLAYGQAPDPGDFTLINESSGRVFVIGDLNARIYGPLLQDRARLLPTALDLDSPDQPSPLFIIVEEGVRLPDKSQFWLPQEPSK